MIGSRGLVCSNTGDGSRLVANEVRVPMVPHFLNHEKVPLPAVDLRLAEINSTVEKLGVKVGFPRFCCGIVGVGAPLRGLVLHDELLFDFHEFTQLTMFCCMTCRELLWCIGGGLRMTTRQTGLSNMEVGRLSR